MLSTFALNLNSTLTKKIQKVHKRSSLKKLRVISNNKAGKKSLYFRLNDLNNDIPEEDSENTPSNTVIPKKKSVMRKRS